MQRLLVLVNGRYAATQCTTIQEALVNFGIVPIPAGGTWEYQPFGGAVSKGNADPQFAD
jgi:hypothetical protein